MRKYFSKRFFSRESSITGDYRFIFLDQSESWCSCTIESPCEVFFLTVTVVTRLHPQGKGGPQAILCGRRLKSSPKSENVPTKQIQKSIIFERSVVYCSWTFCSKKCVFDTSCGTLNKGKLKK